MNLEFITLEELGRAFTSMLHRQGDVVLNSQSPADNAIFLENKIFTLKTSAAITRYGLNIEPAEVSDVERQFGACTIPLPGHMFAGAWLRFDSTFDQKVVNESARMLVPGGIMAIVSPSPIKSSALTHQVKTDTGVTLKRLGKAHLSEASGSNALLLQQADIVAEPAHPFTQCEFCFPWRFVTNKRAQLPGAAATLWGDEYFLVVPDVAPVRPGHLLLLSTRHYLAMGAVPKHLVSRLENHVRLINDVMNVSFGRNAIFIEHGAGSSHTAGSCIDHAHWHCLPDDGEDVLEQLTRRGMQGTLEPFDDIRKKYEYGESYFLVRKGDKHLTYPSSGLPCQFMRLITTKTASSQIARWQTALGSRNNALMYHRTLAAVLPAADVVLSQECSVSRDRQKR